MTQKRLDPSTAQQELTDHPYYKYRGCSPDADDPRLAAGDNGLLVDAWQAPDVDGGEDQEERSARVRAAKAVCGRCPVLAACAVYGASVTSEGRLAERHSILGARTALERTKALVEERQVVPVVVEPAPDEQLRTEQKLAIVRALARFEAAEDVARAAGLDLRTANWQRARLVTQLGLSKSASRSEVLAAAAARGLLADVDEGGGGESAAAARVAAGAGRPVQLTFDDVPSSASVRDLFPSGPELGVAA